MPHRRKALVIGINNYPSAPLRGCINDATAFSELLERHGDQTANFSVNLKTDIFRKATLLKLIADLFSGSNEIALLYFSGHGFINNLGGYLVTPDSQQYDQGISMNDILALANQSSSLNKVIILDCCHSGALGAPDLPGVTGLIGNGVIILTASRHDESAMEVRGKGVFTNLLLEALKGGAADTNGHITPASIYAYIDQALGPWEQRPVFKANISGFASLRHISPRIEIDILRRLTEFFPDPSSPHLLSPSYEYSNSPEWSHACIAPYADPDKVSVFRLLQRLHHAGLVEPDGEEHMYWAAMNGKSCQLTPLGAHYWRLINDRKI